MLFFANEVVVFNAQTCCCVVGEVVGLGTSCCMRLGGVVGLALGISS